MYKIQQCPWQKTYVKRHISLKFLKGLKYPVSVNENVFSYASRGLIDPLKELASTAWTLEIKSPGLLTVF